MFCNDRQTDQLTNRPADLCIKAPSQSLKNMKNYRRRHIKTVLLLITHPVGQ